MTVSVQPEALRRDVLDTGYNRNLDDTSGFIYNIIVI